MGINRFKNTIRNSVKAIPLSILLIVNGVSAETCKIISDYNWIVKQKCWDFDYYIYKGALLWKVWVREVSESPTFVFQSNFNEVKKDEWGGKLSLKAKTGWCNAIRGEYRWNDVIWTAKHCFIDTNNDFFNLLSDKDKTVTEKDNILVNVDTFQKNTWFNLSNNVQYKINPIIDLVDYLWKEFFIVWKKNNKSYFLQWFLVDLRINNKKWLNQWTLYFPWWKLDNSIRKSQGSLNWLSWSPVFLWSNYSEVVGVLCGDFIWWNPDALSINFYNSETEIYE